MSICTRERKRPTASIVTGFPFYRWSFHLWSFHIWYIVLSNYYGATIFRLFSAGIDTVKLLQCIPSLRFSGEIFVPQA